MSAMRHVSIELAQMRQWLIRRTLAHRIQYLNPSLVCHSTAIWDYGFSDTDAIELGQHVTVGPYAEIVVYKRSRFSAVEGRLSVGNRSVISTGVNIRAAGGHVRIGNSSVVSQHCVLVAANHAIVPGQTYLYNLWDQTRTGVELGDNVWVGAGCLLLPGASIGSDVVIGAGSVVTGEVPASELWAGVPARRIRELHRK